VIRLSLLWTLCLFLAPLLLVQGVYVRRRAVRLDEAVGPKQVTAGSYRMLVLGDSIVVGVGVKNTDDALPSQLANRLSELRGERISWRAEGRNGDRIRDLVQRLHLSDGVADLVVINVGVNDVSHLTSMTRWQLELTSLVGELLKRFRGPIVLLGLPPMHAFALLPQPLRFALGVRAQMLDYSLSLVGRLLSRVTYVPTALSLDPVYMSEDGYHPSAEGVKVWAAKIVEALDQEKIISN
jgi:lysophospholipase L1-like esterase